MSDSLLVTYATRYGSTQEVAEKIASTLEKAGLVVDVQRMRDVRTLAGYRAVVLGAPLYMFHWHKDALNFLARHKQALMKLPVAIFVLGPTHDPYDEAEWKDSRAQFEQERNKFTWLEPVAIEMFGGKYNPDSLSFPLKLMAGNAPATDIRDWEAILAWASRLADKL